MLVVVTSACRFTVVQGASALLPVTHRHKGVVSMGLLQKSINDVLVLIPES